MRGQPFFIAGITIAAVAFSCLVHEATAQSQQGTQTGQTQQEAQQVRPEGDMMGGRMMGGGMMGGSMMSRGMMARHDRGAIGHGMMMRMMFSLMDADGDGSISLQEFQAAHERIFKGIDQNKDGRLTMEEMQSFMGAGPGR
jgi:predicted lipid-binding transport protein (Tim44 family)